MTKRGQKSITASNAELGGDPAFGQVKQLRVEYTLDGKPGTATANENDMLILPTTIGQMAKARSFGKSSVDRTFVQPPPHNADSDASFRAMKFWI